MNLKKKIDLVITNAAQLITLKNGPVPRRSKNMNDLSIVKNSVMTVKDGLIDWIGPSEQVPDSYLKNAMKVIDAQNSVVMPGFVDPHTHLVFGGSREKEFALRASGASYVEIAKAGGGILSTVRSTRRSTMKSLVESSIRKLDQMLELGTTTVEIKSGYGLNLDDEIKILKTVKKLKTIHPMTLISTFLGAHTCPPERKKNSYIDLLTNVLIPKVSVDRLAEFCDVFCEDWVFNVNESRKILQTGLDYGLIPKLHTEQFNPNGGYRIAIELDAASADHLDHLSDTGISELAASNVVGVLLPGGSFFLGSNKFPAARKMIDVGMPVAISTDFNPGSSMTQSMPLMMTIACTHMGMSPAEAMTASTINAACAIRRQDSLGTLEPGKKADILILDTGDYRTLPYHFGTNLVRTVIKNGQIVFPRPTAKKKKKKTGNSA